LHLTGAIPVKGQAGVERAIVDEVAHDFRRYWSGGPVAFGSAGIPVVVESDAAITRDCGENAGACHTLSESPTIYVASDRDTLSLYLSHEVLETLADPTGATMDGMLPEVCDPVEAASYVVDGQSVTDFVTPAWFTAGRGPYDQMRLITKARRVLGQRVVEAFKRKDIRGAKRSYDSTSRHKGAVDIGPRSAKVHKTTWTIRGPQGRDGGR
jgi:hypothetical protein